MRDPQAVQVPITPTSLDSAIFTAVGLVSKIWWSNGLFFAAVHIAAAFGVYFWPPRSVPRATLILSVVLWQLADFGITVGYHRLYSHRAFRTTLGVRIILAALGSSGFQGSIKWWCLRHRLHHRFTDDPVHDPYAATRGLFYSHMGWIFFKPTYERMSLVDREDLDNDPVVRFQHKYYVPLALFFGFILPPLLGSLWSDACGAFIWGGLVSRLAIWHCTFLVNSLAHWDGLQPYSDEDTSRGNLILALLTGGEGNHNFHVVLWSFSQPDAYITCDPQHAFPHDFRSGPSFLDWDPSKWIILVLHYLGLATGLRRARSDDLNHAMIYMNNKRQQGASSGEDDVSEWEGELWNIEKVHEFMKGKVGRCVILIDGFVLDATEYLGEHPGGANILREYSIQSKQDPNWIEKWPDASWAFKGGLNNHSRAAKRRMRQLRVAKLRC